MDGVVASKAATASNGKKGPSRSSASSFAMEQLIPIASKLQDVLGALGQATSLDLPQIVVVGGQSSGKSSVLESLVGKSFLPRGTGIVTRRPLILQLFNTVADKASSPPGGESQQPGGGNAPALHPPPPSSSSSTAAPPVAAFQEWGEFLHLPGRKFYDFGAIRTEIVAETERLTGRNRGVNNTPIRLKIYSPHVIALTLVDLPGVAKVAVGDQPEDIERQIQEMCLEYIRNPNAIVLAVTSANTDLANSDALKLAQMVDPSGSRTIGVLTKVDLMDPGTDCSDVLTNHVIPLRRGYVAVVNRGQKDVVNDLSIREGLKKEEKFFRSHPVYGRDRNLLSKCGSHRLATNLNSILMHHIRDVLPDLKTKIATMMVDVQQELDALGNSSFNSSRSTRGAALLGLLSRFSQNFGLVLDGHGAKDAAKSNKKADSVSFRSELFGGARISYIFTEVFAGSLMAVGAFDGLSDDEIRTTICNANGTRPALFVPEVSFDILVRRQIARLESPGIQCVDLVYEELQRIAAQSEPSELTRFPFLRDRMLEVVQNLLRRAVNPTQLMVSNLVKIELSYINTSHPDFIGGSQAVAKLMRASKENEKTMSVPRAIRTTTIARRSSQQGPVGSPLSAVSGNVEYEDAQDDLALDDLAELSSPGMMDFVIRGKTGGASASKTRRTVSQKQPRKGDGNGGSSSVFHLPSVPQTMKPSDLSPTEREQVEMEVIKYLIESYFMIVQKSFIDMVPKTIMCFLVNYVRDSLQNELVSELYRDAEVGQLMQEAEDIAERRQSCLDMKNLLGKALDIVNEVRDFNAFQ
jgi:dynamin 1-like protein